MSLQVLTPIDHPAVLPTVPPPAVPVPGAPSRSIDTFWLDYLMDQLEVVALRQNCRGLRPTRAPIALEIAPPAAAHDAALVGLFAGRTELPAQSIVDFGWRCFTGVAAWLQRT